MKASKGPVGTFASWQTAIESMRLSVRVGIILYSAYRVMPMSTEKPHVSQAALNKQPDVGI